MLDSDLARLYGVGPKLLIRSVRRNIKLTTDEFARLRIQSGSSNGRGGRRYAPYAFSEQGVAMLSSVLRSPRALQVNIEIMRAFVRLLLASHEDPACKLDVLERKYDRQFAGAFEAIRKLMEPPAKPVRRIGFRAANQREDT